MPNGPCRRRLGDAGLKFVLRPLEKAVEERRLLQQILKAFGAVRVLHE